MTRNGTGYISLYLSISNSSTLPPGWEVLVNYKLFVFDQLRDKYLTVHDNCGGIRRFSNINKEWGFAQLISLGTFKEASNGYLVNDSCMFGAEVSVIKYSGKWECLSLVKEPDNNTAYTSIDLKQVATDDANRKDVDFNSKAGPEDWEDAADKEGDDKTYTWKISNISSLPDDEHWSDVFKVGNFTWRLMLHSKEDQAGRKRPMFVFLKFLDSQSLPPKGKLYAEYALSIRDEVNGHRYHTRTAKHTFDSDNESWGWSAFLPIYLSDPKGYWAKNTKIVEVEFLAMPLVRNTC